jgi:hypothetical protein
MLMRNKFNYSATVEVSEASVHRADRHHDRSFAARFPMLRGCDSEYRWGGRLCLN